MTTVLYFGDARLGRPLAELLRNIGYKLVETATKAGLRRLQRSGYCALILDWKSRRDQSFIRVAKQNGIPVIVVTRQLTAAFRAGEPFADLYLEKPTNAQEVAILVSEMIKAGRPTVAAIQEPVSAVAASA